ncbi:hypothetical protein P280DRAFT_37958 [Massarina eburnea CBS 473.64]|uniref:Uncharacterized protein n=1 Tax=Massarina eburnea CBS 473.64 TaxID=1395130 RepID=A0A6A6RVU8_9PLEO|nr:hypothetical protein P280DRAFT_37958 [Massarina eburnea CBS 473.64]
MIDGGAILYPATMQNINAAHSAPAPALYQHELPDSQESYVSAVSNTFSAPKLPSSSSNLSTSTTGDTDLASPPACKVASAQIRPAGGAIPPSPVRARAAQDAAPRIDAANAPRTGDTAASPMSMSLESPMTQGFKRTADGSVKGSGPPIARPVAPPRGHKRTKSTETSRIGELSAQLKTRLSYAMVKVQNGWEKQSLEELEERTSQQGSPTSVAGRSNGSRLIFHSPTDADRQRRPSGISEISDQMMISPGQNTPSDPSRSLAATPSSFWRPGPKPTMSAAANLISVIGSDAGAGPLLGPAPDLSSRRKRRSSASRHPPPLLGSTQRKHYSDISGLAASPRAPITPRAGILRMPSQQAEKDAVDTLLFMSSPNNSSRLPHTSMDAQVRANAPARRVMFAPEGKGTYHPPQVPNSQPSAYYRAEPPR